jgi:hypothetical protein
MHIYFVWFAWGEEGILSIKWGTVILFGMCFAMSSNLSTLLKRTRSVTSALPLKGILEHIYECPLFSPKCFQFMGTSLMKHLQYFDIPILSLSNVSNYNIFTQIIDNLLGRNTMRRTWRWMLSDVNNSRVD